MDYEVERNRILGKLSDRSVRFDFETIAMEIFKFQAQHNPIYSKYLKDLNISVKDIHSTLNIPCLPISAFKKNNIKTGQWDEEKVFLSSGTTGADRSRHLVRSLQNYISNAQRIFEYEYGPLSTYGIIAVLPSYIENEDSSLLYMMDMFITQTNTRLSGYYSATPEIIATVVHGLKSQNRKVLLFGVSYALMDLADSGIDLSEVIVMETGGMKGHRKELIKSDLHQYLKNGLHVNEIHSEYGMTELLSQCYSSGHGIFSMSETLRIRCKEINDPFQIQKHGKAGVIECIDLANFDTISFIATEDLGKTIDQNHFEILGRIKDADLRGCNLLVDQVV